MLRQFIKALIAVGCLAMFQNCGKANFSREAALTQNGNSNGTVVENDINGDGVSLDTFADTTQGNPINIGQVQAKCAQNQMKTLTIDVDFANPGVVCEFNEKGNLETKNGYFQARRVQSHPIGLPAGATLCAADFNFAEQEFWFDDVFVLALNQNILVSSYNFDQYFEVINGFQLFNWSRLQGQFWDEANKSLDYCAGAAQGLAPVCTFPAQHDKEPIKIDFNPQVIQAAMANSGFVDHSFHLVTTGDNDNSDCQHFDMKFQAVLNYVE